MKALVIDDSLVMRRLIGGVLNMLQLESLEASSGQTGMEILNSDPDIDIVILDLIMPNMNGLEVLKAIGKAPNISLKHLIVASASAGEDNRAEASELGATGFLSKALAVDEIYSELERTFRK